MRSLVPATSGGCVRCAPGPLGLLCPASLRAAAVSSRWLAARRGAGRPPPLFSILVGTCCCLELAYCIATATLPTALIPVSNIKITGEISEPFSRAFTLNSAGG